MRTDFAIHVAPGVTVGVHTCSLCGKRAVCAEVNADYVNGADLCGRCLGWLAQVVQENRAEALRQECGLRGKHATLSRLGCGAGGAPGCAGATSGGRIGGMNVARLRLGARRTCPNPRCPNLQPCSNPAHDAKRVHYAANLRGSSTQQGYGARWRRLRAQVLAGEPNCRTCGGPSSHVDHIVPRKRGGTDERENLQGLCMPCHNRKTAKEDGRWGV